MKAKWGITTGDGKFSASSAVTLATGATLDVNGTVQAIGSLAGTAGNVALGGGSLTVGANGTSTSFGGVIADLGGATTATGGTLTKVGTGSLNLTATNAYSGATTVSAGTLGIDGAIGSGSVTVAAAGKLRGTGDGSATGVVNANTVINGTVFPGDVANTLTSQPMGSLTLNSANLSNGGTYLARVLSTGPSGTMTSDKLTLSNHVITLAGTSTLALHVSVPTGTSNYVNPQDTLILDLGTGGASTLANLFTTISVTTFTGTSLSGLHLLAVDGTQFVPNSSSTTGVALDYDTFNPANTTEPNGPGATSNRLYVRLTGSVTPVTVDSFSAKAEGAGVAVEWNLASELQNAGFNIYRRSIEDGAPGEWVKANASMLAGRITNPSPKLYRYYDWTQAGLYEYRLESIDSAKGHGEFYPQITSAVTVDALAGTPALVSPDMLSAAGDSARDATRSRLAVLARDASGAPEASASAKRLEPLMEMKIYDVSDLADSSSFQEILKSNGLTGSSASVEEKNGKLVVMQTPEGQRRVSELLAGARQLANASATLPASAAVPRFAPSTSSAGSQIAAKVVYASSGVLLVPNTMLPAGFNVNKLRIQREGITLTALAVTPNGLLLYGPGYSDDYTDKDVFFLNASTGATPAGTQTTAQGLFDAGNTAQTTAGDSATTQFRDVYFDYSMRPYNYPPYFSSQYLTQDTTQNFTISAPSATDGPATLTVNLWSLTSSDNVSPDHALQASLNGTPLGQSVWSGGGKFMTLTFEVPPNTLLSGANSVDLTTPSLPNINSQIALLHSMTVAYGKALAGPGPVTVTHTA